jgi:hypothetical protein
MTDMADTWQERMEDAFQAREPFLGHPLLPIPLRETKSRTERVSTYVEYDFYKFMQEYAARGGFRGISEVLRRLAILGAKAEGYQFDEKDGDGSTG